MTSTTDPLDTIARRVRADTVISRSRFIATLAPAIDRAAATAVIAEVRREWHDAGHHAMAMIIGPRGQQERSSDDGEPAGTAGSPMLAVLRGAEVTDVVAVVTRYVGGTLLGTGGLVRAYGGVVRAALDRAERLAQRPVAVFDLHVGHADAGRLEHLLRSWVEATPGLGPSTVGPGTYAAAGACFRLEVPLPHVPALRTELASSPIIHQLDQLGQDLRRVRR